MATAKKKWTAQAWQRAKDDWRRWSGAAQGELNPGALAEAALGKTLEPGSLMAYCFRRFGPPNTSSDDYNELCRWLVTTPMADVVLTVYITGPGGASLSFGYLVAPEVTKRLREEERATCRRWRQSVARWGRRVFAADAKVLAFLESWSKPEKPPKNPKEWNASFAKTLLEQKKHEAAAKRFWDCRDAQFHDRTADFDRFAGPFKKQVNEALSAAIADLKRPVYVRDVPINCFGRMDHMRSHGRTVERSKLAGYYVPPAMWEEPEVLWRLWRAVNAYGGGAAGIKAVLERVGGAEIEKAGAVADRYEQMFSRYPWWQGADVEMREGKAVVMVRVGHDAPDHLEAGGEDSGVTYVVERAAKNQRSKTRAK